jgi:hypothetical protein
MHVVRHSLARVPAVTKRPPLPMLPLSQQAIESGTFSCSYRFLIADPTTSAARCWMNSPPMVTNAHRYEGSNDTSGFFVARDKRCTYLVSFVI